MITRTLLLAAALLAVGCGAATGSDPAADGATRSGAQPSQAARAEGPQVPERSFARLDGGEMRLSEFAGQPMVVNFWASWCPPCIAEMPDLERVHGDLGDRLHFVGINTQDDRERARELATQTGVTYDLGLDPDGELFRDLEVVSMPSTYLVDADGVIVHRHAGLLTEGQLRDLLGEHLEVS